MSSLLLGAIERRDHPAVLRYARDRAELSQTELAHRLGFHPSVISRMEAGHRRMDNVDTLRRLAGVLQLPAAAFGLEDHESVALGHLDPKASRVVGKPALEEDDVRRRSFLKAGGVAMGAAVSGASVAEAAPGAPSALPDPAVVLTARLSDVLVGAPAAAGPELPAAQLTRALAAARVSFGKSDFLTLAAVLPELVRAAEVTQDAGAKAQAYTLVTRALVKLRPGGLEWISADRAVRAGGEAGQPLVLAEAERMLSGVCRRAGDHDRAETLVLQAAGRLALDGRDPRHLLLHSNLLCTGGYSAARAGDGGRAHDLLAAAAATADRLDGADAARAQANLLSHRVSVEQLLGEPEAALQHARMARGVRFPDVEREGRYLVDLAAVQLQLGQPGPAYNTLLLAERRAPGEVRTRAAVRNIVNALLNQSRVAVPGIRDLAARVHVAA
ncbi:helix-turn-helix transcriptional regulator [Amycolatopsis sp., V23-08]|uniref:Helix-turn-helix transcriptional regulator n=1 Tax=Amycolatopsis heterodermiae TaxID=3110235 RepID=A0ABU5RLM3_9PSEU|nr:helix-turn-helix transcriptional regulator [Amycolatopsis sp., V23-08]MEA5367182.1 helix-turn-helix transcriptional regulator [Amycolatopsis sp., V23-08]